MDKQALDNVNYCNGFSNLFKVPPLKYWVVVTYIGIMIDRKDSNPCKKGSLAGTGNLEGHWFESLL